MVDTSGVRRALGELVRVPRAVTEHILFVMGLCLISLSGDEMCGEVGAVT